MATPLPKPRGEPTPAPATAVPAVEAARPSGTSTRVNVLPKPLATAPGVLPKLVERELVLAADSVKAAPATARAAAQAHVDAARSAFEAGRNDSGYFELGKLYFEMRLGHAAVDLLEKAVTLDAASAAAHKALGDAYMLIGKTRQAHEQAALAAGK